uniref:Serpentine receptor class gamma n=1 Tax=Caenorhabditis tropicalis TaxID=1561998 RepID=A0A1I7TX41_9PELO
MVFSYLTNGMIALGGMLFPFYTMYLIVLRPFMNDLDTVLVPWIFYLTHPVFRNKSSNHIVISSRDRIIS